MSVFGIDYSDERFVLGKNTLIIGGKGKTNLILTNIFLKLQSKINHLFVVSQDNYYKEITNHIFDEIQLGVIFQEIQNMERSETKLLIIDELNNYNSAQLEFIMINSNLFNVTVVMAVKVCRLGMVVRDYIDNVVIGGEKCVTLVRSVYDKYGGLYSDFSHFLDVVMGLGKDEFLFIGRGSIGIIRVNSHWMKYLYSYKKFLRYDFVRRLSEDRKNDELLEKVNRMMDELAEIRKKLEK